jgi:hypothetical protein
VSIFRRSILWLKYGFPASLDCEVDHLAGRPSGLGESVQLVANHQVSAVGQRLLPLLSEGSPLAGFHPNGRRKLFANVLGNRVDRFPKDFDRIARVLNIGLGG